MNNEQREILGYRIAQKAANSTFNELRMQENHGCTTICIDGEYYGIMGAVAFLLNELSVKSNVTLQEMWTELDALIAFMCLNSPDKEPKDSPDTNREDLDQLAKSFMDSFKMKGNE